MNRENFSSPDLKRCVLKIGGICIGECSSCRHTEAVRDVLLRRDMSPRDILAMDEVSPEIQEIFRSACNGIGEIVEYGVGGCDHTVLHRHIPLTNRQLDFLDSEL